MRLADIVQRLPESRLLERNGHGIGGEVLPLDGLAALAFEFVEHLGERALLRFEIDRHDGPEQLVAADGAVDATEDVIKAPANLTRGICEVSLYGIDRRRSQLHELGARPFAVLELLRAEPLDEGGDAPRQVFLGGKGQEQERRRQRGHQTSLGSGRQYISRAIRFFFPRSP